jgi:hypothetical protein
LHSQSSAGWALSIPCAVPRLERSSRKPLAPRVRGLLFGVLYGLLTVRLSRRRCPAGLGTARQQAARLAELPAAFNNRATWTADHLPPRDAGQRLMGLDQMLSATSITIPIPITSVASAMGSYSSQCPPCTRMMPPLIPKQQRPPLRRPPWQRSVVQRDRSCHQP